MVLLINGVKTLPEEIKYNLKSERNDIINETTKSGNTCTYFETCKSTLALDDLKVYPNPANQDVSIEFTLSESTEGIISLVNNSGIQVKTMLPSTSFNSGSNSFKINLSDVSPGIYLVSITTKKGFKTQRLIIFR